VFAGVRYCDRSLHLANLFLLLTSALIPLPDGDPGRSHLAQQRIRCEGFTETRLRQQFGKAHRHAFTKADHEGLRAE
jgi:hypothetical protein